jgi:nitrate/nitrite transporter NarK
MTMAGHRSMDETLFLVSHAYNHLLTFLFLKLKPKSSNMNISFTMSVLCLYTILTIEVGSSYRRIRSLQQNSTQTLIIFIGVMKNMGFTTLRLGKKLNLLTRKSLSWMFRIHSSSLSPQSTTTTIHRLPPPLAFFSASLLV